MAANETTAQTEVPGSLIGRESALGIIYFVERLRRFVDWVGRWASLLFVPLVIVTVFDVCLRKTGRLQIDLIEAAGPFGVFLQSTLLQESEWHLHTALFALVLGYGYIWNTQVRVDLVRETLPFRRKVWIELIGCTFFMLPFTMVIIYFATIFTYDSFMISEISASQVGLPHRFIIKGVLCAGFLVAWLAGFSVWLQSFVLLVGPSDLRFHLMTLEWPEKEGDTIEGKERLKVDMTKTVEEDLKEKTNEILGTIKGKSS